MNIIIFNTKRYVYELKKIYENFLKKYSYNNILDFERRIFINNKKIYTPKYSSSLIDRVYKMRHLYIKSMIINNNYDICQDDYNLNSSYNTSYQSYGSYSSYTSYQSYGSYSSYNSFSSYYGLSSFNSYTSHSSYNNFTPLVSSYFNSSDKYVLNKEITSKYPFVNLPIYEDIKRPVYKNEYQYTSCNIQQNFFVTGYGLELI